MHINQHAQRIRGRAGMGAQVSSHRCPFCRWHAGLLVGLCLSHLGRVFSHKRGSLDADGHGDDRGSLSSEGRHG